jgi:hypothetical protein
MRGGVERILLHNPDEAVAPVMPRLNVAWCLLTVSESSTHRGQTLMQGVVRDRHQVGPQVGEEFLPRDHAGAMPQQVHKQLKGAGLQVNALTRAAQGLALHINGIVVKSVEHRRFLRSFDGRATAGRLPLSPEGGAQMVVQQQAACRG